VQISKQAPRPQLLAIFFAASNSSPASASSSAAPATWAAKAAVSAHATRLLQQAVASVSIREDNALALSAQYESGGSCLRSGASVGGENEEDGDDNK